MSQYHQENEFSQQNQLPHTFTDQIVRLIQNKNRQNIKEHQHSNDSQSSSVNYNQSVLKRFANKISNRTLDKGQNEQNQVQYGKKRSFRRKKEGKMSLSQKNLNSLRDKKTNMQANKARVMQDQNNILIFQRTLKQYFDQYLTKILDQMQLVTNEKLQQISQRIEDIEKSLPNLYPVNEPVVQKKGAYIKNREKLEFIEKIEKGKLSIMDVADMLNVKQRIVRSWMLSKQSLMEKEGGARRQKRYQKQLQNILF